MSKTPVQKTSLKHEVFRAQEILQQIRNRFASEYKVNSNILGEIRSYKEKLKYMEDERLHSLEEIEKHMNVIAKTNEELEQRLVQENNLLEDADETISDVTSENELDETDAKNIAEFTDALTLQLGDTLSEENVKTTSGTTNLEKYLKDLYEELCRRVRDQQDEVDAQETGTELLEIKALLDEGEKRLLMLSDKMEADPTTDAPTTPTAVTSDKNAGRQTQTQPPIREGSFKTGNVAPIQLSYCKAPYMNDRRTQVQQKSPPPPPPVQDGWVKEPQSNKPAQRPATDSTSFTSDKSRRDQGLSEYSTETSSTISRPIGPVKASSFGIQTDMGPDLEGRRYGSGRDYFEEMFQSAHEYFSHSHDNRMGRGHVSKPATPPLINGYNATTSSAIGSLCILEINEEGKFVRIYNADRKEAEIGNYIIKQNVGGHPVIVFRFPPRTKFPQNSIITVWAASCDNDIFHDPPSNYIWDSQVRWGVGPEFTTILCKPNGQAIAWTNAAHRYNPQLTPRVPVTPVNIRMMQRSIPTAGQVETRSCSKNEIAFEVRNSSRSWDKNLVFLERRKRSSTPTVCIKHPYGQPPESVGHPSGGKDSEANLQTDTKISHTPEQLSHIRTVITKRNSSSNGGRTVNQPNIYTPSKNKNNSNKKTSKKPEFDLNSRVAFMKPSTRLKYGLELIRAQYDMTYNPPMPKLSRAAW